MEWALVSLFAISALLLIISFLNAGKAFKARQKEIDMIHISISNEISELKETIQEMKYDLDILYEETEISPDKRIQLREMINLYKRKYAIATIAKKLDVTEKEVKESLKPYMVSAGERSNQQNEN